LSSSLKSKALRLLARREHSRAELTRKLSDDGNKEDIQAVLDQLERSGLLSDARFAESFVSSRAARVGNARLRHDLRAKGIADDLIVAALPAETDSETSGARSLATQVGVAPADRAGYARARLHPALP
jgi:regulatory protein